MKLLKKVVAVAYIASVVGTVLFGLYSVGVSHNNLDCVTKVQQFKYVSDKAVRDASVARDRALRVLVDVRGQPDSDGSRAAQKAYDAADDVVKDAREDHPVLNPRQVCKR